MNENWNSTPAANHRERTHKFATQISIMAEEKATFEESAAALVEKTTEFIEDFVSSKLKKDPLTNPIYESEEFAKLDLKLEDAQYDDSAPWIADIVLTRVLADLINLRSVDNNYNKFHIAVLFELSFYLKYHDLAHYDFPHTLLVTLIKDSPADWLLDFWPYLDTRVGIFKKYKNNGDDKDYISPIRACGIALMIALNTKLDQMKYNMDSQRDFLRAKILKFSTDVFPLFDKQLVNKRFESNHERDHESKFEADYQNLDRVYNAFWYLQKALHDPAEFFATASYGKRRSIEDDFVILLQEIREIELSLNPRATGRAAQDPEGDNRAEVYYMNSLSDSKKEELQRYYDGKDFNPSFIVNKEKFKLQLKNDPVMRRTVLNQIIIFSGFLDSLSTVPALRRDDGGKGPNQKLKTLIRDVRSPQFFIQVKKDAQEILKIIEVRYYFVALGYREFAENYFINSKVEGFKNFNKEFTPFEITDEFSTNLEQRSKYKPRFWAKYGTAPISKHWNIETGLDKLRKESDQDVDTKLNLLRDDIKNQMDEDTSSEIQVKELLNWKSLRLARKNNLFKFKQVNEIIGLEGIYDPSIKAKYDEEKGQQEQERLKMERIENEARSKERQEREAKEDELQKEQDAKDKVEAEDQEKKRKASQDLFDEESKRVKLESAGTATADEGTDLDY